MSKVFLRCVVAILRAVDVEVPSHIILFCLSLTLEGEGACRQREKRESVDEVYLYALFLALFCTTRDVLVICWCVKLPRAGWTATVESELYRACNNHGSNYGICFYNNPTSVSRLCDCRPIAAFRRPGSGRNDKLLWGGARRVAVT